MRSGSEQRDGPEVGRGRVAPGLEGSPSEILEDLEGRKTTGLAAMDEFAALDADKEAALESARQIGLSGQAFGVLWSLRGVGRY